MQPQRRTYSSQHYQAEGQTSAPHPLFGNTANMGKEIIRGDMEYYGKSFVALADSHDELLEALELLTETANHNIGLQDGYVDYNQCERVIKKARAVIAKARDTTTGENQ